MRKLLRYLKPYIKESILGPLFKLLEASFDLLIPLVMANIIDIGIYNRDLPYIFKMGAVILSFGVVGLVCAITAQYFAAKAAVGFATGLRSDLFRHIQSLSYSQMDTIGTSTLITRMTSDVNQVQTGLNVTLRLFLRSPFIVFGAMIMAFTINVKAALVFVVTIPLLSIVVFGIMMLTTPGYRKVQNQLDQVLLHTRENLTGARVIRAFNKEEEEREIFTRTNTELVGQQTAVGKISALMNPLTYVIVNGALAILIWTGAWQVDTGVITQGEVVALINYMSQILVELVKLANLIVNITKSLACANRIAAVLEMEPDMQPGAGVETDSLQDKTEKAADESEELSTDGSKERNTPGKSDRAKGPEGPAGSKANGNLQETDDDIVIFDQVSFSYSQAAEASLIDIDFRVKRGQTIGIIGGTGSGKTSLVNLIPRFYEATKGRVLVDGVEVENYTYRQLRDKIGIVPQKAVLFHGTIAENLQWGRQDATEEEMYKALEAAQALDIIKAKDKGLASVVQQGGRNLSGGQRQRLTIARALVRDPQILILDDSASALDYATDAKLRKAISELNPRMTVFIVSQRAASIRNADQILVLDDGKMVGKGTHDELLETCEIYQEIYYSQFPRQTGAGSGR